MHVSLSLLGLRYVNFNFKKSQLLDPISFKELVDVFVRNQYLFWYCSYSDALRQTCFLNFARYHPLSSKHIFSKPNDCSYRQGLDSFLLLPILFKCALVQELIASFLS